MNVSSNGIDLICMDYAIAHTGQLRSSLHPILTIQDSVLPKLFMAPVRMPISDK